MILFFKNNWNKIVDLVTKVFNTLSAVAENNTKIVADGIEFTMARGIQVIFNFFMTSLGLGGIVNSVIGIFKKIGAFLRKTITKAVSGVVNWVKGKFGNLFGKGKPGEVEEEDAGDRGKKPLWYGKKESFVNLDQEHHNLKLGGNLSSPIIEMASDKYVHVQKRITARLNEIEGNPELQGEVQHLEKAASLDLLLEKYVKAANKEILTKPEKTNYFDKEIDKKLTAIANELHKTDVGQSNGNKLPPSKVTWQMDGDRPSWIRAEPLSKISGNTKGSGPAGLNIKGWNYVEAIPNGPNNWVRFHLLNENLHGPGAQFNLVPTTVDDNNTFKTDFENNAKKAVNAQNKIIRYNVKVYYHSSGGPSRTSVEEFKSIFKYFPKKIIASAEEVTFDRQKNNWKKTSGFAPKPWIRTFPTPFNLDQLPLSLYSLDAYQMNKWLGLNQDFVSLIRDVLLEDRPEDIGELENGLRIKAEAGKRTDIKSKWQNWWAERLLPLLLKGNEGGVTLEQ